MSRRTIQRTLVVVGLVGGILCGSWPARAGSCCQKGAASATCACCQERAAQERESAALPKCCQQRSARSCCQAKSTSLAAGWKRCQCNHRPAVMLAAGTEDREDVRADDSISIAAAHVLPTVSPTTADGHVGHSKAPPGMASARRALLCRWLI